MKNGSQNPKNRIRQILGRCGEERAAAFLGEKGFSCLAMNWRCRGGELDLIVERGSEIRFVEVKTRKTEHYGAPEEAVTPRKLAHLRLAAERWISEQAFLGSKSFQFDVITVLWPGTAQERLVWIENID